MKSPVVGLVVCLVLPAATLLMTSRLCVELYLWALCAFVLATVVFIEKESLRSIGLGAWSPRDLAEGCAWFAVMTGVVLAVHPLIRYLGIETPPSGGAPAGADRAVRYLVVFRAGVVEEVIFRGYPIDRLTRWTKSRLIGCAVPLAVFTAGHAAGGAAGVIYAAVLGASLTVAFAWRRNLKANIVAHLLVDFLLAS